VVFYSISNCHPGLAGVSFGNFLIKQVVEEVGKRYSKMKRYVTLSPIPGFCRWLATQESGIDLEEMRSMARTDTAKTADILVYLVAHKQFKTHVAHDLTIDFAGLFK